MAHWSEAFDSDDLGEIARYLETKERMAFDPEADGGPHPDDVFFWPTREQIGVQLDGLRTAKLPDGRPFRCYPVIIDSPHPNAFARELDRTFLIGLNAGMATVAYELAAYVMSRRDTFLDVGNPEAETAPPVPEDAMLGYWIYDRVASAPPAAGPIGVELIPKDPVRKEMAYNLSHLLMRFAWFHETFHCLNGHCSTLKSMEVEPELHEMAAEDELPLIKVVRAKLGDAEARELLHSFEFDADRCALRAMLDMQTRGAEFMMPFRDQPLDLRLKLSTTAASLMTYLFAQASRRPSVVSSESHPRPEARLRGLRQELIEIGAVQSAEALDGIEGRIDSFL